MGRNDFEFLEVLGRGASGVCRKIKDKQGHVFVIKQIDLSFVAQEELDSAISESGLLSSLSHPNVIKFYEDYIDDEMLHIVMEYAPYGTLKQNLNKMPAALPEENALWIFQNIINGLVYLHQKKILHRDLKSDNIFIGEQHIPKLGDFGVAKRLNTAQPMAVSVVGTPLYLSPELCNGQPYDAKSDVWACGVLLYEICSQGRLPFHAGNHGAVIKKILMGEYAPLPSRYSTFVQDLLGSCLRQNPTERPSTEQIMQQLVNQPGPSSESLAKAQTEASAKTMVADHFGKSNAEDRRRNNQPIWWDWATNNGFVTGKFRTLYGGTPHPSPNTKTHANDQPYFGDAHAARAGQGIQPFHPRDMRPTSAPSTPSTSGSPKGQNRSSTELLDFLTPAIREGPLRGPLWGASKSKTMRPSSIVTSWDSEIDELRSSRDSERDSPEDVSHHGGGIPLAFTAVDDLTGWLQQHVQLENAGEGAKNGTNPLHARPTSSPDYSQARSRRPSGKPPSRVTGFRIIPHKPSKQQEENPPGSIAPPVQQPLYMNNNNRGKKLQLGHAPGHNSGSYKDDVRGFGEEKRIFSRVSSLVPPDKDNLPRDMSKFGLGSSGLQLQGFAISQHFDRSVAPHHLSGSSNKEVDSQRNRAQPAGGFKGMSKQLVGGGGNLAIRAGRISEGRNGEGNNFAELFMAPRPSY
uniref:non-specific serine/threonine protein kinase n=1 Tax=Hanusia phi TaxID=3032 RepID=A0A6T7QL64_9CRYP|mmetsp:Transcript_25033/g.56504  ORF Transcript_25033/g.56504 Transcript_25033/m.56504 type:complete len:688 (+) Transcript_25033:175-2238(+)